eukprot:TRINITY_DN4271_c0_g1_i1.p1 TRINITY_DN4271_c0_g1~~TRINITY_DN4271_c0_g1_i1.p1  ORF type:complete len:153 (-),score=64.77 TRINITY_DN4271_c0_g1_i1:144-566(-)
MGVPVDEVQHVTKIAEDVLMANLKNYRLFLASDPVPIVPYLGMWLKDLTYIEESPDFTAGKPQAGSSGGGGPGGGRVAINWEKMATVAALLARVRGCQARCRYTFRLVPAIRLYITHQAVVFPDPDVLIDKSLLCESTSC